MLRNSNLDNNLPTWLTTLLVKPIRLPIVRSYLTIEKAVKCFFKKPYQKVLNYIYLSLTIIHLLWKIKISNIKFKRCIQPNICSHLSIQAILSITKPLKCLNIISKSPQLLINPLRHTVGVGCGFGYLATQLNHISTFNYHIPL